jgi:sec-independent protein translocase protein TatA
MGEFSISHVLILTLILLVFFGPSRLPALGQSLGKALRGFKDAMNDTEKGLHTPPPNSNPPQNSQNESLKSTDESVTLSNKDKQHQNNS